MRKLLWSLATAVALSAGLLAGCGGGGGGGGATTSTTISGSAVKGPVGGATVTARVASTGAILGTTTTSPLGTYSFTISHSGDVVVEITGGTYLDEATGVNTTLSQLKAIVSAGGGSQTVHITPLTYLAYTYAGNTSAGFNTALANLGTQFGLGSTNLLSTLPVVTGTTNPYGQVLRAISKYVQNQGGSFDLDDFITLAGGDQGGLTTTLQISFSGAFTTINPGQTLTFSFNSSGITIGGTGVGGGTGTCGVAISGTLAGSTVNNLNYCVTGIAAGSCASGSSSLTSDLNTAFARIGGVNLIYNISPSCAANSFQIALTP